MDNDKITCVHKTSDGYCTVLSDEEEKEFCLEGPCPYFYPKWDAEEQ